MAVSSNTLFHFTNSLEVLCKILEEGFWPKYSKETGWISKGMATVATSMVSFCDIPLSQIHKHAKYYGYYGIGVSKTWGVKSHFVPVNYITNQKPSLLNNIREKAQGDGADEKNKKKQYNNEELLLSKMKVYTGWNWKVKGKEDWKWEWIEGHEQNEQRRQDEVKHFLNIGRYGFEKGH